MTGHAPAGTPELSVVIPAHNAGGLIEQTLGRLAARLRNTPSELIVVENGSTDDTFERCRNLAARWQEPAVALVVMQSEKGMGIALRTGALASRGRSVLLTADDLPFGFDDIDAAERMDRNGARPQLIIGSKAHPDSRVDRGRKRAALTWAFRAFRRVILGMRTGDPQGTLLMDGALLRTLCARTIEPGFLFTTELTYLVERMGLRPVEVPVRLDDAHDAHETRVSLMDGTRMGLGLLRLRVRHGWLRSPEPSSGKTPARLRR